MPRCCLIRVTLSWMFAAVLTGNFSVAAESVPNQGAGPAHTGPLQIFTVKDCLQHQWTDEIIHFPISFAGPRAPESLTLTDATGQPVPCQVTGLAQQDGKVTGTVWTVVSLPPKGQAAFHLQPGQPASGSGSRLGLRPDPVGFRLRLVSNGPEYVLRNEFIALRLPRLPGALAPPVDLASLPAPLLAVSAPDGKNWLGQGAWIHAAPPGLFISSVRRLSEAVEISDGLGGPSYMSNPGQPLLVREATTRVIEEGPVRVTVRYRLTFADGRFYQADITLGDRQECALVTEDSNVESPQAAFRFSFQPGLGADRVYWRNNYFADQSKGLTPGPIAVDKEAVLCKLRPWSFWWLKDLTAWAGFYKEGAAPFVGVLALRPSRWTPSGWDGFDRTEVPITARPGGQLDLTLALLAWTRKQADGTSQLVPVHREWAITVGAVADHVTKDDKQARLRQQLIKYSEFPLDEVKDFGFDFRPAQPDRHHPRLIFTRADVERVRRQAKSIPSVQAEVARATRYITGCGGDSLVPKIQKQPDGWKTFYRENYRGNYLFEVAPLAYLGSAETKYGLILAAGVKGMARENMEMFLEAPHRPAIGDYGPWFSASWMSLLLAYDAIADSGYLTAEEKRDIEAVLLFGARFLAHPDYWNTEVGLCSANPNMTSSIKLPLGLLALFLDGHPQSAGWLKFAEEELKGELKDWIAPGGAWIESPGYQAASLDGMLLLAQALRNVNGRDYFSDPQFKATLEYYGFLLTPRDRRFPPKTADAARSPMTLPSIGDTFAGYITPFNGWMAAATAKSDPAYSVRQQFFWKGQEAYASGAGRAQGYTLALTDPELPAAPPAELSRPFPGFGSILRTAWGDPHASYVAHRNGYFVHHYHQDYNGIVYFAKGAPLCADFGNLYSPVQRGEPYYHSTVSFDVSDSARHWGLAGSTDADALELRSLPRSVDYSAGRSRAGGNQRDDRYLLLVKSDDPLGANYVVIRDVTRDGQPNQEFFWNLWCLSKDPQISGSVAHFPGQFGVDLDVLVLSPANPQFVKDHWDWKQHIYVWANFAEEQYGVHVRKQGSAEDFFTVLYPRAAGQGPAQVASLADGRGVEVGHMEGHDVVLLSPGKPAAITRGDVRLSGEVVFARRYTRGVLRLAVIKGAGASAAQSPWSLRSDGPVALTIQGTTIEGESSGNAHAAQIALPPAYGAALATLDGKPFDVKREGDLLTLALPAGHHTLTIKPK